VLDCFSTPLVIEPSAGQLSSDAGLLPIREFDEHIGLTRAFAEALDDPRPNPTLQEWADLLDPDVRSLLEEAAKAPEGLPPKRPERSRPSLTTAPPSGPSETTIAIG
jgi:hypothetical protein